MGAQVAFVVMSVWILSASLGRKLPYVDYCYVPRSLLVFGVLYGFFFYGLYVKRVGPGKTSSMTSYLASVRGGGSKAWRWIVLNLVAVIIPFGFAITSASLPALAAQITAEAPFMDVFVLENVDTRAGTGSAGVYRLSLVDARGRRARLNFHRGAAPSGGWQLGASVRIQGRSSVVGVIAERVDAVDVSER